MYCISLNPNHLDLIKNLNYKPVGLGNSFFNKEWLTDKNTNQISQKNDYYGEYTFHYAIWKNNLITKKDCWIGFCQYRKFWVLDNYNIKKILNFKDLQNLVLKNIPKDLDKYDSIIGNELFVNQFKLTKFLKKNFFKMVFNPNLLFDGKKRNIKFHFDLMHGNGNLDKAISVMEYKDREDFNHYVNSSISFNPHNMFICKNKNILTKYYESLFPWLERCEKIFGFKDLKGYGLKRIYGFLAERYMSFWFKKYTKYYLLPIIFKDLSDFDYKDL